MEHVLSMIIPGLISFSGSLLLTKKNWFREIVLLTQKTASPYKEIKIWPISEKKYDTFSHVFSQRSFGCLKRENPFLSFGVQATLKEGRQVDYLVELPLEYLKNLSKNDFLLRVETVLNFCHDNGLDLDTRLDNTAKLEMVVGKIPERYLVKILPLFLDLCEKNLVSNDLYISGIAERKCLVRMENTPGTLLWKALDIFVVEPKRGMEEACIKNLLGKFALGVWPSVPLDTFFPRLSKTNQAEDPPTPSGNLER